mgnify:CR=1 FL=1
METTYYFFVNKTGYYLGEIKTFLPVLLGKVFEFVGEDGEKHLYYVIDFAPDVTNNVRSAIVERI